ncbi:MAG: tadB [Herminiimonas sp.]|nr:tadB [Herminiimonas sp.]
MPQLIGSDSILIMSVLVFVTVLLAIEGVVIIWQSKRGPTARKLEQRLNALAASLDKSGRARVLKQHVLSELPRMERLILKLPRAIRLQRTIHQAGLDWTVSTLALASAIIGIALFIAVTSLGHQSILTGALLGTLAATVPSLYVAHRRSRRLRKIEQQLPDALDLMVRALKSGHAFSSGLQMLGEEMAEPLASEFGIVHDEVNFGVSLQQALTNLSVRVPLTDLRYFVVSVMIQRESGGNLAEVLANLSRLIRERLKLRSKIKVLSSEGRLSAWILGLMPFFIAGVMNIMNPDFMSPLWTDPIGISIVKYTLIMMAVGVLILIKIVKIRV